MQVRFGCGPFPPSRKRYFRDFSFVEMSDMWFEPVKPQNLEALASEAPKGFEFVVAAWRWLVQDPLDMRKGHPVAGDPNDFGFLQPTDVNRQLWTQVDEMAVALGAFGVLFKTPASFSPSTKNRKAMAAFVKDVVGDTTRQLIWEPRGLWDFEDASEHAAEIGMVLGHDPFIEARLPDPPDGPAYYVLTGPHGRARFDDDDRADFCEYLLEHEHDVTVVFRGEEREANARKMQEVWAQIRGDGEGT